MEKRGYPKNLRIVEHMRDTKTSIIKENKQYEHILMEKTMKKE